MPLDALHRARRQGLTAQQAAAAHPPRTTPDALYLALWAHADGHPEPAREHAQLAHRLDPNSEFARLLPHHLEREHTGVYDAPEAFGAFIRGGGNVELYRATSRALARILDEHTPRTLLDVGPGDGLALLPALNGTAGPAPHVDLVEPSTALLEQATDALQAQHIGHRAHNTTVEELLTTHPDMRWDLAQSTFALQSLSPHERGPVLAALAQRTGHLAVVEFDVAHVPDPFDPHWFDSCLQRLERGLREYEGDRDLVGTGFILPVVLGHFATHTRTNHEHSIQDWIGDLEQAGFTHVQAHHLCDYWWEPAWLLRARGRHTG
ncbi:class I SAM-dependent methyltransferase [Nocardiopsis sp. HNM0947]|uniref:Class I SAM-dependent methyltransferase n=1 Tax=Nocardiopsis coralli TaxID=2772213 RepID=A0ABR9P6V5_9ACTN|nr:class I SAM-dependent methyltransferase [Nocardiopsis coralli]MBE2999551.1 class I SAM-dependent methyltransferase [Nocardiopsis coralli]